MKRDVNATLLLLLLLAMFSIIILILYNTYAYHNLGKRYKVARAEIEKAYIKLNVTQKELGAKNREIDEREAILAEKELQMEKYFEDLNLSKQRESSLGEMFDDLRDDNLELKTDISGLNNDLGEAEKEVKDLTKTYNAKVEQYNVVVTYCNNMDVRVLEMNETLEDMREILLNQKSNLDSIEEEAKDIGSNSIESDANRADSKRKSTLSKINTLENLISAMEYWATKFREAKA